MHVHVFLLPEHEMLRMVPLRSVATETHVLCERWQQPKHPATVSMPVVVRTIFFITYSFAVLTTVIIKELNYLLSLRRVIQTRLALAQVTLNKMRGHNKPIAFLTKHIACSKC